MSYVIGVVEVENFGPLVKARYDFSRPGLTMIEGEIDGFGCDSNGAGKSKLIEAPFWCLFGRLLNARTKEEGADAIRLLFDARGNVERDARGRPVKPPGGCQVTTHIVGGPRPMKVARYQDHPEFGNHLRFWVGGEEQTQGRMDMTQLAVDRVLGMDFRTAVSAVAFGATKEARGFFSATDAERKQILNKILVLDRYVIAEKIARERARVATEELERNQAKIVNLRGTLEAQGRLLAEVASEDEIEERRWQVKLAKSKLALLTQHKRSLKLSREDARGRLRVAHAANEEQVRAYRKELSAYEERMQALADRKLALHERSSAIRAELRMLDDEVQRWSKLAGRRCPTCEQVLPAIKARQVQARSAQARAVLEREQASVTRELEQVRASVEDPPKPPMSEAVERCKIQLRRFDEILNQRKLRIASARERYVALQRELEAAERRGTQVKREVDRTRSEIATTEKRIADDTRLVNFASFGIEAFGNSGLRSFLIENELPRINKLATRYARRLFGPGAYVRLSATRNLKGGGQREELSIESLIPGCTPTYAKGSTGQRTRLDLCLLLALREVVARRSGNAFRQFFADELFDGLDETGEEFVVELLRELAESCPVILVTHSPRLKSIGDRTILVRHRQKGVASVHESALAVAT